MKVAIADYGCGNIQSVVNAAVSVGATPIIASDPESLKQGDKIILPGVGAFVEAKEHLVSRGFEEALNELKNQGCPILGICLGMQLLCLSSDEGVKDGEQIKGLGWIDAQVTHFRSLGVEGLKVPHMGWNEIQIQKKHALVKEVENGADVYFVHSHAVTCNHESDVLTYSEYGTRFVSSFAKDNVMGMQFHPEKSHRVGLKMLENFFESV